MRNLDILSNKDLDFVKQKLTKRHYNLIELIITMYLEISPVMNSLLYKTPLKIRESDKGNSMVIVNRQDYMKQMNILSDQKKFTRVNINDETLFNFAVNQEKHVAKVLKKRVESSSMTEKNRKLLKHVASRRGVTYG